MTFTVSTFALLVAAVATAAANAAADHHVSYDGHRIIRIDLSQDDGINVSSLVSALVDEASGRDVSSANRERIFLRVAPNDDPSAKLEALGLKDRWSVIVDDLGEIHRREAKAVAARAANQQGDVFDLGNYHTMEDINEYLFSLEGKKSLQRSIPASPPNELHLRFRSHYT